MAIFPPVLLRGGVLIGPPTPGKCMVLPYLVLLLVELPLNLVVVVNLGPVIAHLRAPSRLRPVSQKYH